MFTAGFILIDRFLQNTALIRCLPFDRIEVRYPGTGAPAGSLIFAGGLVVGMGYVQGT